MPGTFTDLRCPECGSSLLSDSEHVWCSYIGGRDVPSCTYGVSERVSLLQALMDQRWYGVAQEQGRAIAKQVWLELLEPKYAINQGEER